ncbi:UDP-3-O-acyl-N-acetylglucosamine deacetylase [Salipiger marinus]|uniref:UDP-3-O-acyl-N-acetylglucosamine deacetylase n=1 Tax=Salipiger marinus TaxID=555512 RepID=UPI001E49F58C|nr:UDP-3-O-acyl-N-acetylglucosamine deacetylase [Salipiger manganoxidans]MCD1616518.1 UDP-3-O-acyl-N-acetylglucosamine deacetylase [Salipiger manganoxidans]MEB3418992.1 UDP-3-O-acyl-N-acetylglucosamine deacetylase [Salipiger manganoxidans]
MQTTIRSAAIFDGVGLHSGAPARMTIRPAPADHGIRFKRTDIRLGNRVVPALWDAVEITPLCTRIVNAAGVSVSTIEHVMAALSGCGIHNALIDLDGPEVPILDGSAAPFVRGIMARGVRHLAAPVRAIEVLAPVEVQTKAGWARLEPGQGLTMNFHIDFPDAAIGTQDKRLDLANGAFVRELCDSRTFCRQSDVDSMQKNGLALGGTYENAVVVDGDRVLSPGGLRHADEAVRHKMLDALGDLYTAGAPILGHYTGFKAGHALTNLLLRELFATPEAWRLTLCDERLAAQLPGVGVEREEIPAVA